MWLKARARTGRDLFRCRSMTVAEALLHVYDVLAGCHICDFVPIVAQSCFDARTPPARPSCLAHLAPQGQIGRRGSRRSLSWTWLILLCVCDLQTLQLVREVPWSELPGCPELTEIS